MKISEAELAKFLNAANKASYANKDAPKSSSLRPSSEDYHFQEGELTYHDTYFGSRDFIGEEIVYRNGSPVWGMNYYGYILDSKISAKDVYDFLRDALLQESVSILPVRGPQLYKTTAGRYTNKSEGPLSRFTGEEQIFLDGEPAYRCWYHGGSIE